MSGGFGPRFVLEISFLVLLALAAGLAELSTVWIVAVMVVGWVLVSLVEWLAWRSEHADDGAAPANGAGRDFDDSADWDLDDILAPLPDDDVPA